MIRRGFWVTVGAVAGIMGYRRVVSAGRAVSGTLEASPRTRRVKRGLVLGTLKLGRDAHRFRRDVREGMELYMTRHPGPESPTLPASADVPASTDLPVSTDLPAKPDTDVKDDR